MFSPLLESTTAVKCHTPVSFSLVLDTSIPHILSLFRKVTLESWGQVWLPVPPFVPVHIIVSCEFAPSSSKVIGSVCLQIQDRTLKLKHWLYAIKPHFRKIVRALRNKFHLFDTDLICNYKFWGKSFPHFCPHYSLPKEHWESAIEFGIFQNQLIFNTIMIYKQNTRTNKLKL